MTTAVRRLVTQFVSTAVLVSTAVVIAAVVLWSGSLARVVISAMSH